MVRPARDFVRATRHELHLVCCQAQPATLLFCHDNLQSNRPIDGVAREIPQSGHSQADRLVVDLSCSVFAIPRSSPDYGLAFGASESTIFSKRGSPPQSIPGFVELERSVSDPERNLAHFSQ